MRIISVPAKFGPEMIAVILRAEESIRNHCLMSEGEDAPFPGGIIAANGIDESRRGALVITIAELPEDADRVVFALAQLVNHDPNPSGEVAA